jgi:hypothetical protein
MFRAATAPAFSAPARSRQQFLRRAHGDPRRFGQASAWIVDASPETETEPSSDLRLFAHSFAGFFLFFSLLIA